MQRDASKESAFAARAAVTPLALGDLRCSSKEFSQTSCCSSAGGEERARQKSSLSIPVGQGHPMLSRSPSPKPSKSCDDLSAGYSSGKPPDESHECGAELWAIWSSDKTADISRNTSIGSSKSFMVTLPFCEVRGGDHLKDGSCLQHFVMGPNSKYRMLWDFMSVFVVGYDVLTVPLSAFPGLAASRFMHLVSVATTIFWTLDIPLSFLQGFYEGGVVEMRPKHIALHYVRKWFIMDLLIILTDWVLLMLNSAIADIIGLVRISKTLRISRLLRLLRLLRVMKMPALIDDLIGNFQSEALITFLSVSRSLALIAIVNHFIACGWYAISELTAPNEPRWIDRMEEEHRSQTYCYVTALHWSLTQFTPASMEVFPTNSNERVFAIIVLFSALVTFSTFVSSITTAMTSLRRINTERSQQQTAIRRYITDNQLSMELGNKILAFVRTHNFGKRRRVHEEDVQVFKVLPETLRLQLHWEVYAEKITPHPLFHHVQEIDEHCLFEICHKAMNEVSLGTSEELFTFAQQATKTFFMQTGCLEYAHANNDSSVFDPFEAEGDLSRRWFCEVVLWIKWDHRGRLTAISPCEFVALEAQSFRRIVAKRPQVLSACRQYARAFQQLVVSSDNNCNFDVWCDFDECQALVHQAFGNVIRSDDMDFPPAQTKFLKVWRSWSPRFFKKRDPGPPRPRRSNSI